MTHDRATRPARAVTLRDVAAAAGVSVWTASTAYSNPQKVAETTRQRIHDAAQRMGYAGPHPGARSLARGRTGVIAFIAPGDSDVLLSDPAARLVAQGLLHACSRQGRALMLTGKHDDIADGRIYFRHHASNDPRVPGIVLDGPQSDSVCVSADTRPAVAWLVAHLREQGHRHLAVLSWPGLESRLHGVYDAWPSDDPLEIHRLDRADEKNVWPSVDAQESVARTVLRRNPRPTAILALTDTLALRVLQAAHWAGLRVPEDVSVVGVDDIPRSAPVGLSTALVPYRPMGERACAMLMKSFNGGPPPESVTMPVVPVLRATTGPVPRQ